MVDTFTDTPELLIEQTAYGIGHREMDIPNALRVQLASPAVAANPIQDDKDLPATTPAFLLECVIDDMSPELLGVLMDRLFAAGASDVNYIKDLESSSLDNVRQTALLQRGAIDYLGDSWLLQMEVQQFQTLAEDINNDYKKLPQIDLQPIGGDSYEVDYDRFNEEGTYQLTIYATDAIGNSAVPRITQVTVGNPLARKGLSTPSATRCSPRSLW